MNSLRVVTLTSLAMIAFAGNSLLCRAALQHSSIDPASFTTVRLATGALMLWVLLLVRGGGMANGGSWISALALFIYAAGFSFAYMSLDAGTGALLLFGAVQVTMIGVGFFRGERLTRVQTAGVLFAFAGLTGLLLPGLSAPPLSGSLLMILAGIAWGFYSLLGKNTTDPIRVSAGNFLRTLPLTALLSLIMLSDIQFNSAGLWLAAASGALASAIGYAIWYSALPLLRAATAASVQLSVPAIAALGGVLLLGEPVTLRLLLASLTILGGIALVIRFRQSG